MNMSDRTRTAIAFLLIIGILLIWSLTSRSTRRPTQPTDADSVHKEAVVAEEKPALDTVLFETDTFVVDRENFRIVLSSAGGSVKSFYLKDYGVDVVPEGKHLFVTITDDGTLPQFTTMTSGDSVIFVYENLDLRKVYHFNNEYGFQLVSHSADTLPRMLSLRSGLRITEVKNKNEDLRHFNVYLKNEKFEKITSKIKDEYSYAGQVDWFALRSKYFLLVVNNLGTIDGLNFHKIPKEQARATSIGSDGDVYHAAFGCPYMRGGGNQYGAEIVTSRTLSLSVMLLPVKHAELATFDRDYEKITSGGILGPISRFFLLIFSLLYALIGNYGFAIMIFAILIKLVFFPLSRQMIASQHKMQLIQPEMKKLQKKYKDDAQRLNQEMMQLYKTYKVNPFSGCLPLVIQMPIFFAMYQTLITSIEFRQAPFILWITDLSLKDPYYVLPIAMGVIMLVQSLLTTVDPRQRFMVMFMPVLMVFIFLNFPSGLQLYWFTYNILTMIEHILTRRGGLK